MANQVTGNPFIIDTANASAIDTTPMRRLRTVRWVGGTTAGHTAIVSDGVGIQKWAGIAGTTNWDEESHPDVSMTGLLVPTLASGKLYLYFD